MTILNVLLAAGAVVSGGVIGVSFGFVQEAALRRNQKLEASGQFAPGVRTMSGSFRRVAYLMLVLVAIQLICPLLFADGYQWFVSGGVVVGYGLMLLLQLRQRLARSR